MLNRLGLLSLLVLLAIETASLFVADADATAGPVGRRRSTR